MSWNLRSRLTRFPLPSFRPFVLPGACALLGLGIISASSLRPAAAQADMATAASRATGAHVRERLRTATDLYQKRCARCHAADGTGSASPAPDFTNPRWQKQRSNEQLIVAILEGKGNRMPPFRGKVSEEGADELVTLIRTFDPTFDPAAAKRNPVSTDEFSKRFRELDVEMERLKKQFRELSAQPRKP
jgi:mono/diheme cytochrome c family protein